jgi:hypothetical protein
MRFSALLTVLLLTAPAIFATTIRVPADQPTIQAGINAAMSGDTVLVAPGTYTESLLFGIDMQDPGSGNVRVISEAGPDNTILQPVGPGTNIMHMRSWVNDAELQGFKIKGSLELSAGGTRIYNNVFCCLSGTAISAYGYLEIKGNVFRDCTGSQFVLSIDEGFSLISDNIFYNNSETCIHVGMGARIENNLFYDNQGTCIQTDWERYPSIINNTFDGNARAIFVHVLESGAFIRNNIITNSSDCAFCSDRTPEHYDSDYNNVWNNATNYVGTTAHGAHDISTDPQYNDRVQKNYSLRPNSPCIDVGDPDHQYNDPNGTRNDMGAFPFNRAPKTIRVPSEYATIQMAVDSSIDGDTIMVADGTYHEHIIISHKSLQLRSENGSGNTYLISDTSRCMTIDALSNICFEGLSLTGNANVEDAHDGGALLVDASTVFIRDSRIANSSATGRGGGIYANNSRIYLRGSSVTGNQAVYMSDKGPFGDAPKGGGIYCVGFLSIDSGCVISDNLANGVRPSRFGVSTFGGGIYCEGDSIQIINSTIANNHVSSITSSSTSSCGGGGIDLIGDHYSIHNCDINQNTVYIGSSLDRLSSHGGGICLVGNGGTIINNKIRANGTSSYLAINGDTCLALGGGIYLSGNDCKITNNIIDSNSTNISFAQAAYSNSSGGGCYLKGMNVLRDNIIGHNNVVAAMLHRYQIDSTICNGGGIYASGLDSIARNTFIGNCDSINNTTFENNHYECMITRGAGCYIDSTEYITQNVVSFNRTIAILNGPDSLAIRVSVGAAAYINASSATCNIYYGNIGQSEWSYDGQGSNFNKNPLFCDTAGGDFTIKNSSPCLPGNNSCGVQIGAKGVGCQNIAPLITSLDSSSAVEDTRFLFRATATDPDGPSLTFSFINHPAWLTVDADIIFGTPHYGNQDTSFVVIVSDGFLADTQLVSIKVHKVTPEVTIVRVENDSINLHVVNHAPEFNWHYVDPTGSSPQTEFEIGVGTDDNWNTSEMWNPAPLTSADSFVVYNGSPLVDGATYYLRLRSYNGSHWSPWANASFHLNSTPSLPVKKSPKDLAIVSTPTPVLYIANSTDAESDPIKYDYQIYTDSLSGSPVMSVDSVPQQPDSTEWVVNPPLDDNGHYFWRVRAYDGYEHSAWSGFSSFWVNSIEQFPSSFSVLTPSGGDTAQVYDIPPLFVWSAAIDPDPLDSVYYTLKISLDSFFLFSTTVDSIYQTQHQVNGLQYGTHYWWKAAAHDTKGNITWSTNTAHIRMWVLGDANADGLANVGDAVYLINFVFKHGNAPVTPRAGDINGDCSLNVGDIVYMINYIFKGGPPPKVGCATAQRQAVSPASKTNN